MAKLLKFQETFPEKFLVSGFGADAPTYNAHEKRGSHRVFYIVIICWNCRSKPCFKVLFEKSALKIRKTFAPNTPLYLDEAFEDSQETFSEKFLVSGFGAEASTFNAHVKSTALPCFFYFSSIVGTDVPNLALRGF